MGGKTKKKTDWKKYNNSLVRRGELLVDFNFLEKWDEELKKMNENKRGKPYHYPDSFIKMLAFIHMAFHLPFRQLEGFIEGFAKFIPKLEVPDYSSINWRVNKLKLNLKESLIKSNHPITIAIDASGIKIVNSGSWIVKKWKKRKGYMKIHFAVDIETKQVTALEVTDERVHDNKKFDDLLDGTKENYDVEKALADGAYDSKDNFGRLEDECIMAGIKVRDNSIVDTKDPKAKARNKAVAEMKQLGYKGWRDKLGYGYRWMSESAFSAFKRIFGEHVSARIFENMVNEILLKVFLYNTFLKEC